MILKTLIESTLSELYDSAVLAFPNTKKRQHATQPIEIVNIRFTPFLGVRTLMVRGTAQNEDREYETMIVFKNVQYHDKGSIKIKSDGKTYLFEPLDVDHVEVLVRYSCQDFRWRFTHTDYIDKSLQGRDRKRYNALYNPGSANPTESEGICKHLMKFSEVQQSQGLMQ